MSCSCRIMRSTKNFLPRLDVVKSFVKNLLPVNKKILLLPVSAPPASPVSIKAPPDCLRCGFNNHPTSMCKAKYDVNGYEIGKPLY